MFKSSRTGSLQPKGELKISSNSTPRVHEIGPIMKRSSGNRLDIFSLLRPAYCDSPIIVWPRLGSGGGNSYKKLTVAVPQFMAETGIRRGGGDSYMKRSVIIVGKF